MHWEDVPQEKRVAVSHIWQSPGHPTPDGAQFSEILDASRQVRVWSFSGGRSLDISPMDDEQYIFFDFLSLFQQPRDYGAWRSVMRNEAGTMILGTGSPEEEAFQLALEQLTTIFSQWVPFVVCTSRAELQRYINRSWCYFEVRQMLVKFATSGGAAFFCAHKVAFKYVDLAAIALPPEPDEPRANDIADYYYIDLHQFLQQLARTSVTNGSDKALLVRIYTQAVTERVWSVWGARAPACARLIIKGLKFLAATSELGKDDTTTVMKLWRTQEVSIEDFAEVMSTLNFVAP